ncbi:MAG: hypothetical protein PHX62_03045 [Bacilli bacterium]|nr:hypothetical protein [Bacilli bacterium]
MNKTTTLTTLDFRTLKYCNLFLMKFQRRSKLWVMITMILSVGIIVYDILKLHSVMFSILGGVFILYSIYQFFSLEKKLDQQLTNFFRGRPVNTQTVEVDEEKITVIRSFDAENPIVYDWAYVNQIFEMPQFYMLMVGKGSPVIIDRAEEAVIDGSKEILDQIVHDKAQVKPYKVTEEDLVKIPITFVHEEFPTAQAIEVDNVSEDVEAENPEVETDIFEEFEELENDKVESEEEQ